MFPLVLDLTGRRVVVVGAGPVGVRKAHQLAEGGATVTVVAPRVAGALPDGTDVVRRPFRDEDLDDTLLVVAASGVPEVDAAVVAAARGRGALVNVVDDPVRSSFYFTATHRDGEVVISVSTEGASPALARWVRDRVGGALPGAWARSRARCAPSGRDSTTPGRRPRGSIGPRPSSEPSPRRAPRPTPASPGRSARGSARRSRRRPATRCMPRSASTCGTAAPR
ncbi:MAG: bifunctional precorrin-2 dehydrogenase/sirohydrochlorin ferrochelatase [Acidimicrobiales bacterium]